MSSQPTQLDFPGAAWLNACDTAAIVDRALRLFGGEISIENSADPEDPATVYLVVRVSLRGSRPSIDEIIDWELQWHREVAQIAPETRGLIRLLVE
jgi:hypothetical protein